MAAPKIVTGYVTQKAPSIIKEIILGIAFGSMAGGLWKIHHWNNQRRTREFYDFLDKGQITVVVEED